MGLLGRRSRLSGRASPAAGLALFMLLGGCSFVPDWADPTDWSYRWANPVNWYQGVFGDDGSEITLRPEPISAQDDEFPQLNSVPDRPATFETAEERVAVAEGLVADREQARYTDEVIRTGAAPEPIEMAAVETVPESDFQLVEEIEPLAPATRSEPRQAVLLDPLEPMPEPPPAVTIAPMEPLGEPTAVPTIAALTEFDLGRVAALAAPAARVPAIEFVAFAPDQGTLSQVYAALLGESAATVTTAPASMAFSAPAAEPLAPGATTVPDIVRETYNAALSATSVPVGKQTFDAPAAAQGGVYQAAVIKFAVGSSRVGARQHGALEAVAAEHKSRGGAVRVVGHASSRTRDLPIDRHMLVNFRISLERAQAVAAELVRLGVSPEDLFVEARSDTEPVFYESMPAGEAENRRAEVFLEF